MAARANSMDLDASVRGDDDSRRGAVDTQTSTEQVDVSSSVAEFEQERTRSLKKLVSPPSPGAARTPYARHTSHTTSTGPRYAHAASARRPRNAHAPNQSSHSRNHESHRIL